MNKGVTVDLPGALSSELLIAVKRTDAPARFPGRPCQSRALRADI